MIPLKNIHFGRALHTQANMNPNALQNILEQNL